MPQRRSHHWMRWARWRQWWQSIQEWSVEWDWSSIVQVPFNVCLNIKFGVFLGFRKCLFHQCGDGILFVTWIYKHGWIAWDFLRIHQIGANREKSGQFANRTRTAGILNKYGTIENQIVRLPKVLPSLPFLFWRITDPFHVQSILQSFHHRGFPWSFHSVMCSW